MSTQKLENRNVRKLTKLGGKSLGLTLPIDIIRTLGWKEKQKVVVKKKGRSLTIKDWKK